METQTAEKFTPTHHALMMAWISRAVVNALGEDEGERIVRKAVVKYGNQRGRRMALRAKADGQPLTIDNYLAYAEVKVKKGDMKSKIVEKSPDARTHVTECAWYDAWEEHDLMPYGRYFCREIDEALVRGFDEGLVLEVTGTRSNGAAYCDFVFKDAHFTLPKMAGLVWKRAVSPGRRPVMPWEYHVGHLYKTLGEVIAEELGEEAVDVMAAALNEFTDKYGEAAGETVLAYDNTDFDRLP